MGSIFPPPPPPPPLSHPFSMPLSLPLSCCLSLSLSCPSISAASFLHPTLPYTSPIIALERCQPPVRPQTTGLSSLSVLLLSPWPHLLNTLLVSGSVESHCGLTKEMWDWFLPLQIKLKFFSCVCTWAQVCVCVRLCARGYVSTRDGGWKRKIRVGKMVLFFKQKTKPGSFRLQPCVNILDPCACCVCLCITLSSVCMRVFEMRVC